MDGNGFRQSPPASLASFAEIASTTDGARVVDQKRNGDGVLDQLQWNVGITLPLSDQLEPDAYVVEDGTAEDVEYINRDTHLDTEKAALLAWRSAQKRSACSDFCAS